MTTKYLGLKLTAIGGVVFLLGACGNSFQPKEALPKLPLTPTEKNILATRKFNLEEFQRSKGHNIVMNLPTWETTPQQLAAVVEQTLNFANGRLDNLAVEARDQLDFENTLGELDRVNNHVSNVWGRVSLLSAVTNDLTLKRQAEKLEVQLSTWEVESSSRRDVYEVVKAYADMAPELVGEQKKLLADTMSNYRRMGFNQPAEAQAQIVKIKKELAEMEQAISTNISQANKGKIFLSEQDLAGLSKAALDSLSQEKDGNHYVSAGIASQTGEIIASSPNEELRKRVYSAARSRAQTSNKSIMEEVIRRRAKLARLLGYNTWADYQTEQRMAGTAKKALDFEKNLISGLQPKFLQEVEDLRQYKARETGQKNAQLQSWDVAYFSRQLIKDKFQVDKESLRKFFEFEATLQGMLRLYEELFAIKVEELQAPYVWDEKVRLLRLSDAKTGRGLGFMYLDMFPRPEAEKYGHFAMFTVRGGRVLQDGRHHRPIVALVCNFPKPTGDVPSLLSLDHVETLFHEFGHGLHALLTETQFAAFSGTSVPRDFVEAPSQMLEYWVEHKSTLDRFARNYLKPTEKIPVEVLNRLVEANRAVVALKYRAQLAYGTIDLRLHTEIKEDQTFDIIEMTSEILDEVFLAHPEGSSFITNFGHLFGGYDAAYYGYAWADRLAADMASVFASAPLGFADKEVGQRLRTEVYARGSSREINESVEAFLGRQPSDAAFLRKLGIGE